LIENEYLEPKQREGDAFESQHLWYQYFNPVEAFNSGPAGSLLIMLYAYIGYLVLREPIDAIFKTWVPKMSLDENWNIDEEIDLYQNCLDEDDKNYSLKEEENCCKYGIRTMLTKTRLGFENGKLKDAKKFHLQGIHTYDILRNPIYTQAFQYFSADLPNRHEYIVDGDDNVGNDVAQSDLVRVLLNLAFLGEDEVKNIEFNPDGLAELQNTAHKKNQME
jgi:hypothetical protein